MALWSRNAFNASSPRAARPGNIPPPDEIAAEIVENLEAALEDFQGVVEELPQDT